MLKPIITLFLFLLSSQLSSQLSLAPTTEEGAMAAAKGGSPQLNLVMMELRNNPKSKQGHMEIVGSPYSTKNYVKSKLYYKDDFEGEFYIRYNALNSIIEIKNSNLEDEKPKRLFADKNVSVKYLNKTLRFTTYINKKKETKNGYLSLITEGQHFNLYHRLAVKFSEGKSAANSMVADIPGKFTHFEEYYFKQSNDNTINYLPTSTNKFIKRINKGIRDSTKEYIKNNSINLNKEDDLIKLFTHLNNVYHEK